jgi:hypothetical protein
MKYGYYLLYRPEGVMIGNKFKVDYAVDCIKPMTKKEVDSVRKRWGKLGPDFRVIKVEITG